MFRHHCRKLLGRFPENGYFRVHYALLAVTIIAAAFLRLYNLDYLEFKGDEALNSFKALKMAEGIHLPLTSGMSSVGIHEPPLFMYLLAIPFLVTPNPVFATAFIAVLNVLGIVVCYFLVRKFYSERAALIAAALYAVNPWQVLFSRKIWTQNLLAPFVMLLAYFMFSMVIEGKKKHLIYMFMVLAIVLQLHLSAAYLSVLVVGLVAFRWKHLEKSQLIMGVALLVLSFTPYLIFQFQNNFVDFHAALRIFLKKSPFHLAAFTTPFKLLTTTGFEYSLGHDFPIFESGAIRLEVLDIAAMGLLFLSIVVLLLHRTPQNKILVSWLLAGAAFMAISKAGVHNHYFNSFHPILIISVAAAVDLILKKLPRYWRHCMALLVIALVAYQFSFGVYFLDFVKNRDCIHGDYGPPFAYRVESVRRAVKEFGQPKNDADLRKMHNSSKYCVKCDFRATAFIVKYMIKK